MLYFCAAVLPALRARQRLRLLNLFVLNPISYALQTAFLKGEISTVRSLQEKVDQLEAALDRLRKELQVNIR